MCINDKFDRCKYEQLHIGYISVHGRITLVRCRTITYKHSKILPFHTEYSVYIYLGIIFTQNKEIILYWPFVLEIDCILHDLGSDFFKQLSLVLVFTGGQSPTFHHEGSRLIPGHSLWYLVDNVFEQGFSKYFVYSRYHSTKIPEYFFC